MKLFTALLLPALFLPALFLPVEASAAILPDAVGAYHRGAVSLPTLTTRDLWDEYGLREYESAVYENGAAKFTAAAYQLQDSTSAMAAFDWLRPAGSAPSNAAPYSAETKSGLWIVNGNYLLSFEGYKPAAAELAALEEALIHPDGTPFPSLPGYLPGAGRVANSERYIIGPAALQQFYPAIPPSVAAFRYSAEAVFAVYHGPKGDSKMVIFNYPTPQIAMDRLTAFQNLTGAMAKRSGPMVAVVVAPPDPDQAERLLSQVQYHAEITLQEHIATRKDNIGNLVVNAFILVGILLVFCIVGGLGVGGLKVLRRRGRGGQDADSLITLNLE